jgi:hypothetical protein
MTNFFLKQSFIYVRKKYTLISYAQNNHWFAFPSDSCGTLTSDPVQEGHNITLIYVPDKKYFNHSRKWYQYVDGQYTLLYDSAADITPKSSKYFEVSSHKDYRMIIRDPAFKYEGDYFVICLDQVVSNTYLLHRLRGTLFNCF